MALGRRRDRGGGGLNVWPGYVDALSTLLMVIIFVLLVFVLAQGFLSVALSSRDRALDRLNRQVSELSEMLALERGQSDELRAALSRSDAQLRGAATERDTLQNQLRALGAERDRLDAERDGLRGERDRLQARLADLEAAGRGDAERDAALQGQLADALRRADAAGGDTARTLQDLADARRQLEALRRQAAEQDRVVQADRATVEARLADLARLNEQVRSITALRDQLERQVQASAAATADESARRQRAEAQLADEAQRRQAAEGRAAEQARLSDSARAQVALLTRQLDELRAQMARIAAALDASEASGRDRDAQITNLGQRLNAALAARVEELQQYRSDFFGRLRQVLGDRPDIRVVGDRFVFQSEVLFPTASAEMSDRGKEQIRAIAGVLKDIAAKIPADVPWVLRVDGHADRTPIRSSRFASNWELSAARAIAVAQLLIGEGLPANRVAAAAFGDNQPLDAADTPEAYARNRRIELRLTDR